MRFTVAVHLCVNTFIPSAAPCCCPVGQAWGFERLRSKLSNSLAGWWACHVLHACVHIMHNLLICMPCTYCLLACHALLACLHATWTTCLRTGHAHLAPTHEIPLRTCISCLPCAVHSLRRPGVLLQAERDGKGVWRGRRWWNPWSNQHARARCACVSWQACVYVSVL